MTLCIAAKALGGQVVTCYDSRMETPTAQADIAYKSRAVAPHWHIMLAGTLPAANELADIYEHEFQTDATVYDSIIDRISAPLNIFRKRAADHFTQTSFAVSHGEFMDNGRRWFGDQLFKDALSDMRVHIQTEEKEIQLLLIGTEDPSGPHIFKYSYGDIWECDSFGAIGSGETIAEAMLFHRKLTGLSALGAISYVVYEAKRMAEITPGVGQTTMMTVIMGHLIGHENKAIWKFVSSHGLEFLERMRGRFCLRPFRYPDNPLQDIGIPDDFLSVGYGEYGLDLSDDEVSLEGELDPLSPTPDLPHSPPSQE